MHFTDNKRIIYIYMQWRIGGGGGGQGNSFAMYITNLTNVPLEDIDGLQPHITGP